MRVRVRPHVPRLECDRERRDRLEIRVLEQCPLAALDLEQMLQVARVEQDFLLRRARLARATGRNAVASTRKGLDGREQVERAERLPHERLGAALLGTPRLLVVGAGQEHDRDLLRAVGALQARGQLRAAHAGHAQVEHDHVRPLLLDAGLCLDGGGCLVNLDVGALEGRSQQLAERGLVVDEQNSHRTSFPLHVYSRYRHTTPCTRDTSFAADTKKPSLAGETFPSRKEISHTSRTLGPFCAPDGPPGRTGGAAGRGRISGSRAPREAPP